MRTDRIYVLIYIFLFIFALLLGKIFYYQIVCNEEITKQAIAMRSKEITLKEYLRGPILDRNHLPLTDNTRTYALYGLPFEIVRNYQGKVHDKEQAFKEIASQIAKQTNGIEANLVASNLSNAMKKGHPIVRLAEDLSDEDISKINSSNLTGVVIAPLIKRYNSNNLCTHLIGYVKGTEKVQGVAGIEKQYDQILSTNALSPQLVSINDARGRPIQGLMFKIRSEQNRNQGTVVLTIDKRIQTIVEEAMDKKVNKGTVVVMDVNSKEILAIASRPSFNPNNLASVMDKEKDSPLTNRAFNRYYPGSLFKILVAAAALEEKEVLLEDRFECQGFYKFTDKLSISCWKKEGHGRQTFAEAFANSCNPAFIELGIKLQRDKLYEYVKKFHLTDETINGWVDKTSSNSFVKISPGLAGIGNATLGQHGVMLTPIQITNLIATIANDGKWGAPSITRYYIDKEGNKHFTPKPNLEQVISVDTAKKVQMLMEEVVQNGTGKNAGLTTVKIAGKTATSQTGMYLEEDKEILNTWFGGYFPADNPKWAIVVMVEEGSSGAADAAPIFKEISSKILDLFSTIK
ncbi:MAG: penicillin-binding protein 2 [Syntrophomonadaceae bacterium]|nr:penicillin-binding protein 2 [Syntrophomonadaceae bacterium]